MTSPTPAPAGTGTATRVGYVQVEPGTSVPFGAGEPFQLFPSNRPDSTTLDVDKEGRISIAGDAEPRELRAALYMATSSFIRVRSLAAEREEAVATLTRQLAEAQQREQALRDALTQVALREGRYSRDPLTHAQNTIENMAEIATAALDIPTTPDREG